MQNRVVQSRYGSYKRSHGMQGGESDPTGCRKERRYETLESRGKKKRSDGATRSSASLTRFHLVQLSPIGCTNCFAYFEKNGQVPGWDLHSVVGAKYLKKRFASAGADASHESILRATWYL